MPAETTTGRHLPAETCAGGEPHTRQATAAGSCHQSKNQNVADDAHIPDRRYGEPQEATGTGTEAQQANHKSGGAERRNAESNAMSGRATDETGKLPRGRPPQKAEAGNEVHLNRLDAGLSSAAVPSAGIQAEPSEAADRQQANPPVTNATSQVNLLHLGRLPSSCISEG